MLGESLGISDALDGVDEYEGVAGVITHPHGVDPAGVVPRVRERDLACYHPPAVLGLGPLEQEELAVAPVDPEVALRRHGDLAAAVLVAEGAARDAREDANRLRAVVRPTDGRDRDREAAVLRALEHEAQDARLEVGGDEDLVPALSERADRAATRLGAAELELEDLLQLVGPDDERFSRLVAGRMPALVLWCHDLFTLLLDTSHKPICLWISIGEV